MAAATSRLTRVLLPLGLALLLAACAPASSQTLRAGTAPVLLGAHNDTSSPFTFVSVPALAAHWYDGRALPITKVLARQEAVLAENGFVALQIDSGTTRSPAASAATRWPVRSGTRLTSSTPCAPSGGPGCCTWTPPASVCSAGPWVETWSSKRWPRGRALRTGELPGDRRLRPVRAARPGRCGTRGRRQALRALAARATASSVPGRGSCTAR
jgi:hypothetical protein